MKVTFGELRRDVALFAAAMRKMGVQAGDRVVGELRLVVTVSVATASTPAFFSSLLYVGSDVALAKFKVLL